MLPALDAHLDEPNLGTLNTSAERSSSTSWETPIGAVLGKPLNNRSCTDENLDDFPTLADEDLVQVNVPVDRPTPWTPLNP